MSHKFLILVVIVFSFCSKYQFSIEKVYGKSIKKYGTKNLSSNTTKPNFIVAKNNKVQNDMRKNLYSESFYLNHLYDENSEMINEPASRNDPSDFNSVKKEHERRENNQFKQEEYSVFEADYENEDDEEEELKKDDNTTIMKLHRRSFSRGNKTHRRIKSLRPSITIPLYTAIFVAAWVGNILVILTVLRLRRMRTVTNIYLLNLSVTDIIFASICMPLTLIPTLMQDFVFGPAVCVLVRYLQCLVVGVCVFTHVAISLERYFAICQPFKSRVWQTTKHCYRVIFFIWVTASIIAIPSGAVQRVSWLRNKHKCLERYPNKQVQLVHIVSLMVSLLLLPLFCMLLAYGKIALTLYRSMTAVHQENKPEKKITGEKLTKLKKWMSLDQQLMAGSSRSRWSRHNSQKQFDDIYLEDQATKNVEPNSNFHSNNQRSKPQKPFKSSLARLGEEKSERHEDPVEMTLHRSSTRLNRLTKCGSVGRMDINLLKTKHNYTSRLRTVLMLFTVVTEFFVCWTPVYVMALWHALDEDHFRSHLSLFSMNLIHLLSFVSSCSNPITYCFMSSSFRQGFMAVFGCRNKRKLTARNFSCTSGGEFKSLANN